MLLFSALLYWRGEQVAQGIRHFATRLAGVRGDAAVLLAAQAIRAVALGVVVTALVQAVLGGIGLAIIRRTLCNFANGVNDPLLPCPAWTVAGTDSGDYLALLDWRYHTGNGIVSLERCGWHAR